MGKLDASIAGDVEHAYVPNLAAKGAGYTFSDASGVAQRLLGNFGCGREEQEVAVIDALKVGAIGTFHRPDTGFCFLFLPSLSPPVGERLECCRSKHQPSSGFRVLPTCFWRARA